MFPTLKNREKGNEKIANALYIILNIGIILRLFFEPFSDNDNGIIKAFLVLSAFLQFFAMVLYVYLLWGRARAKLK